MLTSMSNLVNGVFAHSSISVQHMFFWCPFFRFMVNHTTFGYGCIFRSKNVVRCVYLLYVVQVVFMTCHATATSVEECHFPWLSFHDHKIVCMDR